MKNHLPRKRFLPAVAVAFLSLALLAACTGEDGRPGAPGAQGVKGDAGPAGAAGPAAIQGEKGEPGQSGNPGARGSTGPQGTRGQVGATGADAVSVGAGIMVSSPAFYLDEGLTVAGSGFQQFEAIIIYFDLGGGDEPTLGFADANRGGAWALTVPALDDIGGISGSGADLVAAGVATLRADGADGSAVSIPVSILGISTPPAADAPPAPGAAPSVAAGTVETGADIEVVGAGYAANESVTFYAITGPGPSDRSRLAQGDASDGGVVLVTITASLEPGAYTLEGAGAFGSVASAALIVVEGK